MSKFQLLISIVLKLFGFGLTVLFIIQVSEIIMKDNRFLFFQILLSFIWFVGAIFFWILGFSLGRRKSKENTEKGRIDTKD